MTVVVGVLADALGHAVQTRAVDPPARLAHLIPFDLQHEYLCVSSLEYRSVQPPGLTVDRGHDDDPIGAVKYLERSGNGDLHAVCEIDGTGLTGPLYYSPHIRHRDGEEILLLGLAITETPASIALRPLNAFPGTLREASWKITPQHGHAGGLVQRALEHDQRRKHGEPLVIQGTQPKRSDAALEPAPRGPVEHRSAAAVDVHRARRELDLLIAPAERPTKIHERHREYVEVFSHGAFAGVERNPEKVKANLHHVRERIIGRAIALNPWAEAGLEGTIKLSRVRDADEALALVDDGLLGVSAGFAIPTGGEQWQGRTKRVRRAELDHVALVVQPAYESATVTAVRRRSATPNLDRVLAGL